jgi:hypothetical protein
MQFTPGFVASRVTNVSSAATLTPTRTAPIDSLRAGSDPSGAHAEVNMADECKAYAAELVTMLFAKCSEDHFDADAKAHIQRLAEYAICYDFECSQRRSTSWWEKKGRDYWAGHIENLVDRELRCGGLLSCSDVQKAVNRYSAGVVQAIRRLVRLQQARELRNLAEGRPRAAPPPALEILGGCPFSAGLA